MAVLAEILVVVLSVLVIGSHEEERNYGYKSESRGGQIGAGSGSKMPGGGEFKVPGDLTLPGSFQISGANMKGINFPKAVDDMNYIDPRMIDNFKFGSGRKYEKNGEESCLHFGRRMLAQGLPAFNDCMKDMSQTIGSIRKNLREALPCIVKCMGIKLKLLKEDGTFNYEYTQNLLKEQVPKRFLEFIMSIWEECKPMAKKIIPGDVTCKTYRPVIHCAVNSAFKVAGEAMKLCPDIPDVFKKTAKSFIKSKKQREELDKTISIDEED